MNPHGCILRHIQRLPIEEQLEEALFWIGELLGSPDHLLQHVRRLYSLTPTEGRILLFLNKHAGKVCSEDQIALATAFDSPEKAANSLAVQIMKLRRKTKLPIENVWGTGYCLQKPLFIPLTPPTSPESLFHLYSRRRLPWSAESDADLLRMFHNGSDLAAMSEECERSERAILDRLKHHKVWPRR